MPFLCLFLGVASDRWAIQSDGTFNSQLSPQQLLDCNRLIDHCEPGKVEYAWWLLQRQGYDNFSTACNSIQKLFSYQI